MNAKDHQALPLTQASQKSKISSRLYLAQTNNLNLGDILWKPRISMIPGSYSSNCFATTYPRIMGGTNQNTQFYAMDMDTSGNIIIGGQSKDNGLIDSPQTETPLVVFMEQGGNYRWTKQFSLPEDYVRVNAIKFLPDYSQGVFVLDDSHDYLIMSINSADGSLDKTYSYGSDGETFQDAILIDSSNNVYIGMKSNSLWKIFKFDLSTGTMAFHKTSANSDSANAFGALAFDSTSSNIFATGVLYQNKMALVSLSISGTVNYYYGVSGQTYLLTRMSVQSSTTLYACSASKSSKMAIIQFTMSSSTSVPTSQKVFNDADCQGIYGADSTTTYLLVQKNSASYTYFVEVIFTTSGNSRINDGFSFNGVFNEASSYIYHGKVLSASSAYWVGQGKQIIKTSPLTYSKKVGIVMSADSTESATCIGSFTIEFGNSPIGTTSWTWATISTDSLASESQTLSTLSSCSSSNVKSITQIDFSWCNTTTTTITASTLYSQTYDIASATGNSTYTIDPFTIALASCTYSFFYVAAQSDQSSLPTGVTFTQSTRTFSFSGATTSGVYTIMVVGYLNNGQTAKATFTLTITNQVCNGATMTPSSLTAQTYIVTNTQRLYQFTAFTVSSADCTYTYSLSKTDYTAFDSALFGFTSSSRTLSIYTTDNAKVGTYTLRITGTLNEASSTRSTYADVTITIQSKCYLSTITTVAISSFTFSTFSASNLTLSTLGWTQLYSSDCPSITYTVSITSTTATSTPTDIFTVMSSSLLTLYTNDANYIGAYVMSVSGTNGYTSNSVSFTGVINSINSCSSTVVSPSAMTSKSYTTTSTALTYTFTEWTDSLGTCGAFTYSAVFSNGTSISSSTGVVKFDPSSRTFTISTSDPYEAGTYSITVTGTLSAGATNTTTLSLTIVDICTTTTITTYTPGNKVYTIMSGSDTYTFTGWSETTGTCGTFSYTAVYDLNSTGVSTAFPISSGGSNIVTLSSNSFSISTSDQTLSGNIYTVTITGACIHRTVTASFTITLQSCSATVTTSQSISTQYYTINDPTSSVSVTDFTYSPSYCTSTIVYTISASSYVSLPSIVTGQSLTSPLSFDLYTTSTSDIGSYTIIMTGTITNYDATTSIYDLSIPVTIQSANTGPPYFSPSLSDLNMNVGDTESITLNLVDDDQGDSGSITSISFGKASAFVKGSGTSYTINPTKATQAGYYTVIISVTDDNAQPLTTTYSFTIYVTAPATNTTSNSTATNSTSNSSSTNQTSTTQSTSSTTPTKTTNIVTDNVSKNLGAYISKITSSGVMTVKFTSTIVVPANYTAFNESIFKVNIFPSEISNSEKAKVTYWNVTDMTTSTMTVYLNFATPSKISLYAKDKVKVQFIQNGFFIEQASKQAISYLYETKSKEIPKQLSKDCKFLVSLEFNSFFNGITQFCRHSKRSVVNINGCIIAIFMGYDQCASADCKHAIVCDNMGSMFIYLVVLILAVLLTVLIRFLARKYKMVNKVYQFMSNLLFFNMPLRMVLEGYMNYSISCIMNMTDLMWETTSDIFSSVLAIVMLTGLLIFPFFVWTLLWKKVDVLSEEKSKMTFGSLYMELRLTKQAVLYHVFYLLRRIMFVTVAVTIPSHPFFQVQALLLQCIALIIFDTLVQPFEEPFLNKIEIFNEVCILGAAYHLILFTEFLQDEDMQYLAGWSIIGVTILNIVVNMAVMMTFTVKKLRLKYKKLKQKIKIWLANRKAKKAGLPYKMDEEINPTQLRQRDLKTDDTSPQKQMGKYNLLSNTSSVNFEQLGDTTFIQSPKSNKRRGGKNKSKTRRKSNVIDNLNQSFTDEHVEESKQPQENSKDKRKHSKTQRQNFGERKVSSGESLMQKRKNSINKAGGFYDIYMEKHNQLIQQQLHELANLQLPQASDIRLPPISSSINGKLEDFNNNEMDEIIQDNSPIYNQSPIHKSQLESSRNFSFRLEQAQYPQMKRKGTNQLMDTSTFEEGVEDDSNAKLFMIHYQEKMLQNQGNKQQQTMPIQEEEAENNVDVNSSLEVHLGKFKEQNPKATIQANSNQLFQRMKQKKFTR